MIRKLLETWYEAIEKSVAADLAHENAQNDNFLVTVGDDRLNTHLRGGN
jgi:hypothetical protein